MDLDEAIEELRDLAESPSITALSSASRVVLARLDGLLAMEKRAREVQGGAAETMSGAADYILGES